MIVPRNLVFLGFTYEVNMQTFDDRIILMTYQLKTDMSARATGRTPHALCCNSTGKAIFILPMKKVRMTEIKGRSKSQASKLFGRWADYDADLALRFTIPKGANKLVHIGQLLKMEYTSDKLATSTDQKGRFNIYVHKFARPPSFYADRRTNPRVWAAKSNRKLVTARGLIS